MKQRISLIRKLKYYFYRFGIHRLVPGDSFMFLGHMSSLSKWIAEHKKNLAFSTFPQAQFNYNNRYQLFSYLIENEIKGQPIDYLEFGVSTGNSFRWWVDQIKNPDSRFYGFDTFTGLPEDWGGFKKGAMSNGNKPPEIDDNRHEFFQGIFQQTLHDFLKNYNSQKRKVIHLDADLYTATLFVLTTIRPYLQKGDLILFDEFNVPMHEYKAFKEWVESFYIQYTVIGEVNNFYQVAMRMES